MDVATISALAATAAAIGAFSVAGVQLYVGHRQSEAALKAADAALMNAQSAGRHTVAEFRQSWMDKVIDALSDYHAILMSIGGVFAVAGRPYEADCLVDTPGAVIETR